MADSHGTNTIWDRQTGWGHTDAINDGGNPNTVAQDGIAGPDDDIGDLIYAADYLDGTVARESVEDRALRVFTTRSDRRSPDDDFSPIYEVGPDWLVGDFIYEDLADWISPWGIGDGGRPEPENDPEFNSACFLRDYTNDTDMGSTQISADRDMDSVGFFPAGLIELIRSSLFDRVAGWGHSDAPGTDQQYEIRSDAVSNYDWSTNDEFPMDHERTWYYFKQGTIND